MSQPYVSELQLTIRNFYSMLEKEHRRNIDSTPSMTHPSFSCEVCAALDTYDDRYPWIHGTQPLNH
jgi:hypothetical protein